MDLSSLIPELAKGGLTVLVLGVILYFVGMRYFDGNDKRIEEIKENNKLLSDAFNKESDAKFALAIATDKQTAVMNSLVERLSKVEEALKDLIREFDK